MSICLSGLFRGGYYWVFSTKTSLSLFVESRGAKHLAIGKGDNNLVPNYAQDIDSGPVN